MNEPIISPWIFYAADVVFSINLVINVLVLILCIATAIAFCDYMSNRSPYKETETIQNRKTFHSLLKILIVVTILNIMIPSKDTFYKMIATSYVTPANIEMIGDNVDKIADKIVDKINKVKR